MTVSDTGMGIDPAIADKIFDPFFTTKSDRNGTGMGLFIVYGFSAAIAGYRVVKHTGQRDIHQHLHPAFRTTRKRRNPPGK